MTWSWTLYQYLGKLFLLGFAVVFACFCFLAFSIDIVGLFNETAIKHVPTAIIIGMALLQLPDLAFKMLPFAVLLGGVFAFVRLSRSQELIAVRAAGLSAWNLLAPPLSAAVAIGLVAVVAFTPFSSLLLGRYSEMEARFLKDQPSQLAVSRNGLWLRQSSPPGNPQNVDASGLVRQSVLHALRVADQGVRLDDVIIFLYGVSDRFLGRVDAQSATLQGGNWVLDNAWVSGANGPAVHHARYSISTALTPARIQESFASPETMSFWALPGFIQTAQQAGFSASRYKIYFDTLLVLPAMLAAMIFMAASFSLRLARLGGMGRVVLYSALAGFGIYFFGNVMQALGISGILPIPLAAAAPAAVAILLGMTLVFHQEDG